MERSAVQLIRVLLVEPATRDPQIPCVGPEISPAQYNLLLVGFAAFRRPHTEKELDAGEPSAFLHLVQHERNMHLASRKGKESGINARTLCDY